MTNRKERRAAASRGELAKRPPPRAPASVEHAPGPYWHITVQDADRAKEEKNLTLEAVLERVAIPARLNKAFRVDGFEFHPARLKRLRITKTTAFVDLGEVMRNIDMSSLSSAFSSLVTAGQLANGGEDVTDDLLKRADQSIIQNGLTPVSAGAFDVRVDPKKAFVVMSFAPELDRCFEAIRDACGRKSINAVRVDKEISSAPVVERITAHLKEASYVVADLTNARPNVYYEIGYFDAVCEARGLDAAKHLLLVANNIGSDAHFDLRHRGIKEYRDPYDLLRIVEEWLGAIKRV